jgi:FkbM family methyltransferase
MLRNIALYFHTVGFAGLLRAMNGKVTNTKMVVNVKRDDVKFPFGLRIPSSDIQIYKQIFTNNEYDFHVQSQPEVIVDAGANIGLASIYFANRYPEAKIIAIEPERENFTLLKRNVAPYANIFPVEVALWHEHTEVQIIDHGRGEWGFRTEERDVGGKRADSGVPVHKVAAVTIDKIMDDYDLGKVDILKVDIEGAEKEVFSYASTWIDKVDALIIELHERMKSGCNRSVYNATNGFDNEWYKGENLYLSRGECMSPPT